MANALEEKREQDNLLDKFIRNEKRSKLWAILSVLAFFGVSGTVLTIANTMKNSTDHNSTSDTVVIKRTDTTIVTIVKNDTTVITKIDTSIIVKADPAALDQIKERDRIIFKLKETLKTDSLEIIRLRTLLRDCGQKPPQTTVSVLLHSYNKKDSLTLKNIISNIINNKVSIVYPPSSFLRSAAPFLGVVYYDQRFTTQANSFRDALNSSKVFQPMLNLQSYLRDPATNKSKFDIEIWINYRSLVK